MLIYDYFCPYDGVFIQASAKSAFVDLKLLGCVYKDQVHCVSYYSIPRSNWLWLDTTHQEWWYVLFQYSYNVSVDTIKSIVYMYQTIRPNDVMQKPAEIYLYKWCGLY